MLEPLTNQPNEQIAQLQAQLAGCDSADLKLIGKSLNAVQKLSKEAVQMAEIPIDIGTLITRTPGIHGGSPHILGKGVTVRRIVSWYKRGLTPEEIGDRIGHLTLAEVYAALTYYHANTAEVEADISQQTAEAQRLETIHQPALRSME